MVVQVGNTTHSSSYWSVKDEVSDIQIDVKLLSEFSLKEEDLV